MRIVYILRGMEVAPMAKTKMPLVTFNCPKDMLDKFDRAWDGTGYASRAELLRWLMWQYICHPINTA